MKAEHWENVKTNADYNYARPDYLNQQLPREVSGWHNFSAREQEEMKMHQGRFLLSLGYSKQPDGSFTKRIGTVISHTTEPSTIASL